MHCPVPHGFKAGDPIFLTDGLKPNQAIGPGCPLDPRKLFILATFLVSAGICNFHIVNFVNSNMSQQNPGL